MNSNTPDPGLYRRYRSPSKPKSTVVFLDRDGVIVEETGYLHKVEDIAILPGTAEAIASLNEAGYGVVLVTNQAGIGRGYYTWYEFDLVQTEIEARLARAGAQLDAVLACAYHPDGKEPFAIDHPYRKPNPGMILDAQRQLKADLQASWMVGDKLLDLEAGRNARVGHQVLVRTGYGRDHESMLTPGPNVHAVETLLEAVRTLILPGSRV